MDQSHLPRAKHSFRFFTHVDLTELTGLRARNLREMADILKAVPGSVIYHHTHRFLKQHQYLSPEPPPTRLAERLAAVDTVNFKTLRELREKIVAIIEDRMAKRKTAADAPEGMEFHFMKSVSFILPTPYQAGDLREFSEALRKVSVHSIYHHVFEARLRLEHGVNDFSRWLEEELGEMVLAVEIAQLDPYTCTLEGLRSRLITLAENRMIESAESHHA